MPRTELRTLVLTRFRPDLPAGGAALRNWQNIQALVRFGTVDVISVGEEEGSTGADSNPRWTGVALQRLGAAQPRGERVRKRLWFLRAGVHPSIDSYTFRSVERLVSQRLQERRYDVAVIAELSLAGYLPLLKRAGCRVVFDAHNVESALRGDISALARRPLTVRERLRSRVLRRRMFQEERRAIRGADVVWACSGIDAAQVRKLYGEGSRLEVVPNGVDVTTYASATTDPGEDWSESPLTLLYPGSFAYYPNADAAMRLITGVLPALRASAHPARVVLVGRSPTEAMRAAAAADPDVHVTGTVDSILPYLRQPCLVVLPIAVGSGTRLKILEAFAARRPVVSTAKGAEGIEAVDGEHLLIRDGDREMAAAVVDLWGSPDRRAAICRNALELVRAQYSWAIAEAAIARSLSLPDDACAVGHERVATAPRQLSAPVDEPQKSSCPRCHGPAGEPPPRRN